MKSESIVSPHDQKVTFVELFFDLVFVFAVTQISHALLAPKEDVDDLASWRRLQALLPVVENTGDRVA